MSIDRIRCIADCREMDYNRYRPHSSLDYMVLAVFVTMCLVRGSAPLSLFQDEEVRRGILAYSNSYKKQDQVA